MYLNCSYILIISCVVVEKMSVEYEALTQFYSELTAVFHDKNYLAYFVSAKIFLPSDIRHMSTLPDKDIAMCIVNRISASLESAEKQSFYKMLEIMKEHGNHHAQKLAEDMRAFVEPVVIENTESVATFVEGMCINT